MSHFSLQIQRGASVTSMMLFIIAAGLLGKFGMCTIPAYLSDYQLNKMLAQELKKANTDKDSAKDFLSTVNRQLNINGDYSTKAEEVVEFVSEIPGNLQIKTNYKVEKLYYGNTYVVTHFNKEINPADAN